MHKLWYFLILITKVRRSFFISSFTCPVSNFLLSKNTITCIHNTFFCPLLLSHGLHNLTTIALSSIITFILKIFVIFIYFQIPRLQSVFVSLDVYITLCIYVQLCTSRMLLHFQWFRRVLLFIIWLIMVFSCYMADCGKFFISILTLCMDFGTPTNCLMECHEQISSIKLILLCFLSFMHLVDVLLRSCFSG